MSWIWWTCHLFMHTSHILWLLLFWHSSLPLSSHRVLQQHRATLMCCRVCHTQFPHPLNNVLCCCTLLNIACDAKLRCAQSCTGPVRACAHILMCRQPRIAPDMLYRCRLSSGQQIRTRSSKQVRPVYGPSDRLSDRFYSFLAVCNPCIRLRYV